MQCRTKWLAALLVLPACTFPNDRLQAQVTQGPTTVQFASNSYTVSESDGSVTLTVTLLGTASGDVTVSYATADGTAVAGTDYTAKSGTVTIPFGSTSSTVSVPIIDNGNYSNQIVSFTVALSNPINAALGTPSVTTVNIRDDDPAPTCDIEIYGVPKADKKNPGGYVPVNANNDNGSALTYDGAKAVPAGYPGIPAIRDFAVVKLPLKVADPDLVQVTLATTGLKPKGPENIVLSVISAKGARGKIAQWDQGTKNKAIAVPTNWTLATLPASVYVEGLLESAALMEITLQLQIQNAGKVVTTDTCVITVTPVLTDFTVTVSMGCVPDLLNDKTLGWAVDSSAGGGGVATMTPSATAQWNAVRGDLRFVQNWKIANNLKGGVGADLGPRTWDFDPLIVPAGSTLLDAEDVAAPFYNLQESNPPKNAKNASITNSITDTPALPLSAGPGGVFVNSVLPAIGKTTNVDVTYGYITYATVAYADNSLYFIGQQPWNIRYAGTVSQAVAGAYKYAKGANNANTGAAFAAAVRSNGNPATIGQPFVMGKPTPGNDAGPGWR